MIVYGALVVANLAMVLTYVKRTIVLGFLIIIAPLITITYSIDKMGDGKSQALNTWMREFIFTVIIQPFHCIIYLVFYSSMINTLDVNSVGDAFGANDLGKLVFAAASAFFMLKAEGIVKKIFGIQPSGIGDAIGTGAMALSMGTSLFKGKGGKKIDESKGKMPDMRKSSEKDGKEKGKSDGANPVATGNEQGGTQNNSQNGSQNGSQGNTQSNSSNGSSTSGDQNNQTGTGNQSASQSTDDGDVAPPNNANNSNSTNNGKIKRKLKNMANSTAGFIQRNYKRNGGFSGYLSRNISRGAMVAGMIAGAAVGDAKTAASVGMAARGAVESGVDNIKYKMAEDKLERNQQEFAGAYEDFAEAYRQQYGEDVSDKEIARVAKEIYNGGGVDNLDSEYAKDFYEKMDQLSTSAEIIGYKNGFDYVKDTMRMVQGGAVTSRPDYEHKKY